MRKTHQINHGDIQITIYPKTGAKIGKNTGKRKRRISQRQTGRFLNLYDFAYAVRDTVNQVGKIASGIINKATSDINKIAQQRIDQAIRTDGEEIERVAPKIFRGVIEIEKVHKTPFRLLGNLGKKQFK